MLSPILLSAVLAAISPSASDVRIDAGVGQGAVRLIYVQSGPEFLTSEQIRMLLTGTEVTHQPPGGAGQAQITFKSDGKVRIRNFKGKTSTGGWKLSDPKVVCLTNFGGRGDKNFCVKLTFDGKNIHQYVPATGEMMGVPPWVIEKPGPEVERVRGN